VNHETGTFACPICGVAEPHHHSELEQIEHRAGQRQIAELQQLKYEPIFDMRFTINILKGALLIVIMGVTATVVGYLVGRAISMLMGWNNA